MVCVHINTARMCVLNNRRVWVLLCICLQRYSTTYTGIYRRTGVSLGMLVWIEVWGLKGKIEDEGVQVSVYLGRFWCYKAVKL